MTSYVVVKSKDIRNLIISEISDPILKMDLQSNNNSYLNMLVRKLEQRSIFVTESKSTGRFAFLAAFNCLSLRKNYTRYKSKDTVRDLFILHELNHMATLDHTIKGENEWAEEHVRNEKASSLWSEALVFFAYPHLLDKFKKESGIQQIWVDRFIDNTILLLGVESNQNFYKRDPKTFIALLFNEFLAISEKAYSDLDECERRTREYDLTTEMWMHKYKSNGARANSIISTYLYQCANYCNEQDITIMEQLIIEFLNKNTNELGRFIEETDFDMSVQEMLKKYGNLDKTTLYHLPFKTSLNGFLQHAVTRFQNQIENGDVTNTKLVPASITAIKNYGVTPIIYSLITNSGKAMTIDLWKNGERMYDTIYSFSMTRTQDSINKRIESKYKEWSSDAITGWDSIEAKKFTFCPTAGANEAIIHILIRVKNEFSVNPLIKNKLHVFAGEYEGAKIHAEAQGISVNIHKTRVVHDIFNCKNVAHGDYFYLSYPSAIDGMAWDDISFFLKEAENKGVKVILDATYIGAYHIRNGNKFNIDSPAIEDFIWSFSKVFGLYYQRVGGMFNKKQPASSMGNLWFKNQSSLLIALNLMHYYTVIDIPANFKELQKSATQMVNIKIRKHLVKFGIDPNLLDLKPCDVFIIANQQISEDVYKQLPEELQSLCRVSCDSTYNLRVCLTPVMEYIENVFTQIFRVYGETNTISILDLGNTALNIEKYGVDGLVKGLSLRNKL